jgi:Uma2 family endonuclease
MGAAFEATKRWRTFRDVIDALPEHLTGQVIGGRLVVLPRPGPAHLNATGALREMLGRPFQRGRGGPGGWWLLSEPELSLGVDPDFDPVNPDLAGWRRERMPHLPTTAALALAPDWVCEVLSPSTEVHDRAEKMPFYARAGVGHAWLVDPVERTLEAFRRDGATFRPVASHRGDATVRVEPFEAVEVDLAYLWAR